jgi:hypothetical protein
MPTDPSAEEALREAVEEAIVELRIAKEDGDLEAAKLASERLRAALDRLSHTFGPWHERP